MSTLKDLTLDQMMHEIKRRQRVLVRLNRKRDRLVGALKAIDAEILKSGGTPGAVPGLGSRQRARNELTLPEAMLKVMSKDKPINVAEIAAAVEKVGYISTSKTFRTIIYQTLGKDKRFKKVARGRYVIK